MIRFRPFVNALIGLLLLVQGYAVAATPVALPEPVAAEAEMPCHGQPPAADLEGPCGCCDGACPDMSFCAMGQIALPAAIVLTVSAVLQPAPDLAPPAVASRSPTSLLRPPIFLPG